MISQVVDWHVFVPKHKWVRLVIFVFIGILNRGLVNTDKLGWGKGKNVCAFLFLTRIWSDLVGFALSVERDE